MDFKNILTARRSVRRFSPTEVSREVLLDIVNQALTAPSSRNMRTSRFIIVDDKPTLEKLSKMRDYGSEFMKDAAAAIIVAADTTKTDLWRENCAISATVLQLAVVDAGLASCWVHIGGRPRLKDVPEGEQAEEYIRTFIDIPQEWSLECAIALGYSDYTPKPLPEHDDSASIVWHTRQ